jgi:hypothetical protein
MSFRIVEHFQEMFHLYDAACKWASGVKDFIRINAKAEDGA